METDGIYKEHNKPYHSDGRQSILKVNISLYSYSERMIKFEAITMIVKTTITHVEWSCHYVGILVVKGRWERPKQFTLYQ